MTQFHYTLNGAVRAIATFVLPLFLIVSAAACRHLVFPWTDGLDRETRESILLELESRVLRDFPFFSGSAAAGRLVSPGTGETDWPLRRRFTADVTTLRTGAAVDPGATTDSEFIDQVLALIATLRDGHTSAGPLPYGEYPGIRLRFFPGANGVAEGVYVEELIRRREEEDGRADLGDGFNNGLRPGDRVIAVADAGRLESGTTVADLLDDPLAQWDVLYQTAHRVFAASSHWARRQFAATSLFSVALRGRPDVSAPIVVRVERRGIIGDIRISAGRREDAFPAVDAPYRKTVRESDREICYIAVPSMAHPDDIDRIDRMINEAIKADAIIFDLRGNSGGRSLVGDYLIARLGLESEFRFRIVDSAGENVRTIGPQRARGLQFTGDIALLIDHRVFSASNHFASLVWYAKESGAFGDRRIFLVGEHTGGGAGIPQSIRSRRDISFRVSQTVIVNPEGFNYERGLPPSGGGDEHGSPSGDVIAFLDPSVFRDGMVLRPGRSEQFEERRDRDLVLRRAIELLTGNRAVGGN